jgi:adenylate kinase family enzyme
VAAPPLESFGRRIMVCGPSSSGKSTLAVALDRRLGLPAIHLDLLQHLPDTDWAPRPPAEFQRLHDAAILDQSWVMEGNYSRLMPQRLARATGIILLGGSRWANLLRYLRRTCFERHRAGAIEGGQHTLKWEMVRWILIGQPRSVAAFRTALATADLPLLELHSMADLRRLYRDWKLDRG